MLLSDTLGGTSIALKVVSPEGQAYTGSYPDDTQLEHVKNEAIQFFYPNGEAGAATFKLVRVSDMSTAHDFLTLAQEQVESNEELLLIERRTPEAGTLWDLGSVRAPQHSAIAAATSSLPTPRQAPIQPDLQTLLSTNELTFELRKILISLIEVGARLAAAGRNYELTLAQLTAALDEPPAAPVTDTQVITPEDIATPSNDSSPASPEPSVSGDEMFRRADRLQKFLDKFRAWRARVIEPPKPENVSPLKDLGYSEADTSEALRVTGSNVPAAAAYLMGERGSSVFEIVDGLPDREILQKLLEKPQIQRGLLNTRMLIAFIGMVGRKGSAALWLNSPHGSPLLTQISRTYHAEKYCLAVNQFYQGQDSGSTSSKNTCRKIPHLYWSGGDVIHDNGFGCYAQRGRRKPIPAENYHLPHSMPGLLSMRVTADDEVCGVFTITFKPLPQLDLKNVVFGRVVRPSCIFDAMRSLGSALSTHPQVEIAATRRKSDGVLIHGTPNTKIHKRTMSQHANGE
ncbi:ubiquitin-associated domain-containing protein 1 [Aricia agestis]|uniref:ubiquitin-associated domain-containing protein 1 n=1 Tax=Aricia agestis TaxID=91739 RepID=UPI001C209224|nr:ubiquitin-associated domain-containing protein 1 [Aricia agestis]